MRNYLLLTKPGIIMGNLITTAGGFFLASRGVFQGWLFLTMLAGLGAVIGSACVCNNYIDRFTDRKMARTKSRALPSGLISGAQALFFAALLALFGFAVLIQFTNERAVLGAAAGFLIYVAVYSFSKKYTPLATELGSVAGAMPPVIGYAAAGGGYDMGALLLFLILLSWQMPHFFAIAMLRINDYAAASIPVLPLVKGNYATKIAMALYIIAFLLSAALLTFFEYAGYAYLAVAFGLGVWWLWLCAQGFRVHNDKLWARKMFRFSLVLITALSFMISVDAVKKEPLLSTYFKGKPCEPRSSS